MPALSWKSRHPVSYTDHTIISHPMPGGGNTGHRLSLPISAPSSIGSPSLTHMANSIPSQPLSRPTTSKPLRTTVSKLETPLGFLFFQTPSLEVGALVAASLSRTLDEAPASESSPGDESASPPPPPPLQLSTARVVGATLPGRLHFTFAGCGQAMATPSLLPPPGGRCLATHSETAFYHINLTSTGLVRRATAA